MEHAPALSVKVTIPELIKFNRETDLGDIMSLSDEFVTKDGRVNKTVISYPSLSTIWGRV